MLHIRPLALAITALLCLLGTADAAAIYDPGTGRFLQRDPSGYPDGMNAYAGYHAMRGGVDPLGLKAVAGNKYGDWDIHQTTQDAPVKGGRYSSDVIITFKPNAETVCCESIVYMQIVRQLYVKTGKPVIDSRKTHRSRQTTTGWRVDRYPGAKYPVYGLKNNGTVSPFASTHGSAGPGIPYQAAILRDTPSWTIVSLIWEFEAYVICAEGKDEKKLYAGLTWGFDVDAVGKVSSHENQHIDAPSIQAIKAAAAWNYQAWHPFTTKNHKDGQVPIPDDITWDNQKPLTDEMLQF